MGFLLLQASLQTGALAPAMTSETVLEALAGVAVGIFVLNERIDQSPAETVRVAARTGADGRGPAGARPLPRSSQTA